MKNKKRKEIFISTDIETTGMVPGRSSMISLGSTAFFGDGQRVGDFFINLKELRWWLPPSFRPRRKDTMIWWEGQKKAWASSTVDPKPPKKAMQEYLKWLGEIRDKAKSKNEDGSTFYPKLVFVAYPAGFDFTFVQWYLGRYCDEYPFGFNCLDMKSYAMSMLGNKSFSKTVKKNFPKEWMSKNEFPHNALADAKSQGEIFVEMYKEATTNPLRVNVK